jgi:hypothetical protein
MIVSNSSQSTVSKKTDIEGKKKVEYNAERKAETDRDLKYLVDKIKTDARAVGNKV